MCKSNGIQDSTVWIFQTIIITVGYKISSSGRSSSEDSGAVVYCFCCPIFSGHRVAHPFLFYYIYIMGIKKRIAPLSLYYQRSLVKRDACTFQKEDEESGGL